MCVYFYIMYQYISCCKQTYTLYTEKNLSLPDISEDIVITLILKDKLTFIYKFPIIFYLCDLSFDFHYKTKFTRVCLKPTNFVNIKRFLIICPKPRKIYSNYYCAPLKVYSPVILNKVVHRRAMEVLQLQYRYGWAFQIEI